MWEEFEKSKAEAREQAVRDGRERDFDTYCERFDKQHEARGLRSFPMYVGGGQWECKSLNNVTFISLPHYDQEEALIGAA